MVEQIKPEDSKDGINFDHARLLGYKGVCFLHLQEPTSALLALQEARNSMDGPSVRQQSIFIADSALALTKQGEIEEACKLIQQACIMTVRTKSEIVKQRIRTVRHEMKPWEAARVVKDLDEQLAYTGTL
jgi:hypothetical protein